VFNNQIPALDTGAKEGAFEIHVSVSVEGGLDVGERLLIGFILEDAAGQRSNEPSMTLEAVKDLS
jgi:hypothetical protein